MKHPEIMKLKALAELLLDHKLLHLRQAADAKTQSEQALVRLSQPVAEAEGLAGATAALTNLAYQRWADQRRAEINQGLARQTHLWMEARDAAKIAFSKAEALRGLAQKQSR